MNSASRIEELILEIEDIRESGQPSHYGVIDAILAKARAKRKEAEGADLVDSADDLMMATQVQSLVKTLEKKFNVLTGR